MNYEEDGFVCEGCNQLKHIEESCEYLGSRLMCDLCQQQFNAEKLCFDCYMQPYPLRLCVECVTDELFQLTTTD